MRNENGHLLLAILPLAVLVGGFVLLSTTTSRAYLEEHEVRKHQLTSRNEANAALAQAKGRIRASAYTNNSNDVMRNIVDSGEETGHTNAEGNDVKVLLVRPRSEVWISRLDDGWYQLDAIASVDGRRTHVRTLTRERDPFTRFGNFVNSHPIGIAGDPKGDIHTNKVLQLFFPDGDYADPVTAVDGFEWLIGADWSNTTFQSGYNDAAENIEMPTVASIEQLAAHSDGALDTLLNGADAANFDIKVELKGDRYDIVAVPHDPEEDTLSALDLPFPIDGVLYFDTDIASLHGTLDGRITVASTGEITISDSIRYVDEHGDPIYNNGLSVDPENEPYAPNPDYDGNAALGVIANGHILYDHSVPEQLELNGVFFSATGRFGLPGLEFTSDGRYVTSYDSSFHKSSIRRYGGVITDLRIVSTVVNGNGDVLSGFDSGTSVYDARLRNEPPPHFLAIDRPVFFGYRIVSGGDAGVESGEAAAFDFKTTPIGQNERSAYEETAQS